MNTEENWWNEWKILKTREIKRKMWKLSKINEKSKKICEIQWKVKKIDENNGSKIFSKILGWILKNEAESDGMS